MAQPISDTASGPYPHNPSASPAHSSEPAKLDHIVILLPHKRLLELPKSITSRFTITPGGQHADGKTENKLILFGDGSYIELISFINDSPENRNGHHWGKASPGIIDYALTTSGDPEAHWLATQARLATLDPALAEKYEYAPPVAGGRLRPDGVEVGWRVTFPKGVERGELPFFCHDVTPRDRRVPFSDHASTHPCGAYGVKELTVTVPANKVAELSKVHSTLLGQENLDAERGTGRFTIETVRRVESAPLPGLFVQGPRKEEESRVVEERAVLLNHLILGGVPGSGSPDFEFRIDEDADKL